MSATAAQPRTAPSRERAAGAGGYFTDASMMRRVHRERAMALSGQRALLMQAAHPLAVAGLLAHTTSLNAPYERLARTGELLARITFGDREAADRDCAVVRAMHRRVHGKLAADTGPYPKGTAYRADAPELLLWILYTLVDSAVLVYRRYVGPLSRRDEAALWDDYKVVGALFGLGEAEMPGELDELHAYGREMLDGDRLFVNDWARRRAREIVLAPPVPVALRPLLETVNFITIALLPDSLRRQYGFLPLPPIAVRRLLVAGGAEYVKRVVVPVLPEGLRLIPAARAPRPGGGRQRKRTGEVTR